MNIKRLLAIIGICAWAALIIITLIVAFTVTEHTQALFNGLIAADILIPVMIWIALMIIRFMKKKKDGQ